MSILGLVLDVLLVILLLATLGYCWVLNRRIQILQDGRSELADLLRHFDSSTERASDSIMALQAASKKIGETIQTRMEKAVFAADDLQFLIERSEKLADRLERQAQPVSARRTARAEEMEREIVPEREVPSYTPHLEEQEMRGVEPSAPQRSRSISSLQSMIEKMGSRRGSVETPARPEARKSPKLENDRPVSRVERELIEMLKSGGKV